VWCQVGSVLNYESRNRLLSSTRGEAPSGCAIRSAAAAVLHEKEAPRRVPTGKWGTLVSRSETNSTHAGLASQFRVGGGPLSGSEGWS
jgi:hypothetical protein